MASRQPWLLDSCVSACFMGDRSVWSIEAAPAAMVLGALHSVSTSTAPVR
eukprot:CAMPEP_0171187004 /NCGR_PEP_ID=MMETSP0790-20130122/17099_1 /TAXON_ID=2925 /ORGANISM="Alexandrium catenella, Strain OF101" /LENGTH=49 /DNA_ID=CAMNT_0011652055 /DNA_START=226 /DNA_END=375 /DNA_ORIENTATION=-